ncbi:MAG: tRNA (guanosine(37)-N1)-methyltransferase TrmD [Clostridiales bacterium]|nr:tRNA (guanosine(37)-N1)-methyltransferase TrmD [Clostridiales bacterium]
MNYHVMTLFPEMIEHAMNISITGRALKNGILALDVVNIRDYSKDKHNRVDDYPYGGGAGMVMQAQPVYDCHQDLVKKIMDRTKEKGRLPRTIYLTPQGHTFHQKMAEELAKEEDLIFLCGHYEGIDERVLQKIVTDQVSIGDYVLTGGELPAMVMMDTISRLIPGVLHNEDSAEAESFSNDLLEYPQYTRPPEFMGEKVPDILLTGNHAKIEAWRLEQAMERTKKARPELYEAYMLKNPPKLQKRRKKK